MTTRQGICSRCGENGNLYWEHEDICEDRLSEQISRELQNEIEAEMPEWVLGSHRKGSAKPVCHAPSMPEKCLTTCNFDI